MFGGTLITQQVSPNVVCLAGLTLEKSSSGPASSIGTIGWPEAVATPDNPLPDVILPDAFPFPTTSFDGSPVPPRFSLRVQITPETDGGFTNLPPTVQISGTSEADARIRIINTKVDERTQEMLIRISTEDAPAADAPGVTVIFDLRGAQDVVINA
jgi:hypothetical protein